MMSHVSGARLMMYAPMAKNMTNST